jgi:signal transduction histidine kinase
MLAQSLRKLLFTILAFYFAGLVATLVLVETLSHYQKRNLANAIATASRNQILVRDLREAMTTIMAVVGPDFDSVILRDRSGNLVFALPPEAADARTNILLETVVDVPIHPGPETEPVGTLSFHYNSMGILAVAIAGWLALLLLSAPVVLKLRREVTRRHFDDIKLAEANTMLEIATQVSHDIRSPLSALKLTLSKATFGETNAEASGIAKYAIARIEGVASDLLAKHRAQTPNKATSPAADTPRRAEPANTAGATSQPIGELIAQVVNEAQLKAVEAAQTVSFLVEDSDAQLPEALAAAEFQRMLSNILNNALEALTTNGEIKIAVRNTNGQTTVSIVDNGRGIPREVQKRIGERGYSHGKSGNGLGLSHAKATLAKAGGNLAIQSTEGRGTIVTLTLPA